MWDEGPISKRRRNRCANFVLIIALALAAPAARAADKTLWKPIVEASLKIDEKPVKLWTVYREERDKKAKRMLLQLGRRFLLIDSENHEVDECRPESFETHGKDLRETKSAAQAKTLKTDDWVNREGGFVRIIKMRLVEEGRVIEIQLPGVPDLRY